MSIDLLSGLLDGSIDDLADMPVWAPKPDGTYKGQFEYRTEAGDKYPYMVFTVKISEILELAEPQRAEEVDLTKEQKLVFTAFPFNSKDGTKSERGEGLIKMVVTGLKETFGGSNNRETLDTANGGMVAVTINTRKYKDKATGEVKSQNELVAIMGAQ